PGGPSKCGDKDLPKNFTCSKGDEISGSVTLCGKPRPNLSWMIGDQSINGTIDSTKADQHQYTYSFKHNATSEMCGKSVSYQATGFQNNEVSGSALIIKDKSEGGGDGGSEGLSGGAIAGIIIGVLVLVVLVALVVLYRLGKIGGGSVAATSEKSPNEQTAMKNENQKV
uniref:Ig-like domain-containing protein n=1 Tax=Clytia hemisphaerica TaxID=252671 RepID=A0A7M5WII4_9CNID